MPDGYDAVVIGAGPAGEVAISQLLAQGLRVALVERELLGGECAYWACVPSKTLLRPGETRGEASRVAGLDTPAQHWPAVAAYRDFMIRGLDDSKQLQEYREEGVDVYKGEGRIAGRGAVEVGETKLATERIILATGTDPSIPAIEGLAEAGFWTNREATTLSELPDSVIILGGGPVGVELAQFFARFEVTVTLVQSEDRLVPREEPAAAKLIAKALEADGIELRLGAGVESVRRADGKVTVSLSDGEAVEAGELLVATGRKPRVAGIGLESVGIEPGKRGIEVDERCRAGEGVWAIGDVTGVMPFTHVGKYQARIAAADIAGESPRASYEAIPRVVFSDPELAAVGLTEEKALEKGLELSRSQIKLRDVLTRPWTYEQDPRGDLGLLVDRKRKVLVGAWAVAPLASEWIHQAALALKTETPVAVLRDTVAQFPTFSEAYLKGLEALEPAV
ncbi:MAG TPA: NAD(P)/FAD-dependent oxidoreductase [Solirubrobacteraceae bacterium]|jgi:dihydrolipoamide dehydrogenase|nr:NAD(P)/FAD-dependent oxidoreductase [Solirubrobacteraceae bacterium]